MFHLYSCSHHTDGADDEGGRNRMSTFMQYVHLCYYSRHTDGDDDDDDDVGRLRAAFPAMMHLYCCPHHTDDGGDNEDGRRLHVPATVQLCYYSHHADDGDDEDGGAIERRLPCNFAMCL